MKETLATLKSKANVFKFEEIYSIILSSSPIFFNVVLDSFNCSLACKKYLPSVHKKLESFVISKVPALPVKPLKKDTLL